MPAVRRFGRADPSPLPSDLAIRRILADRLAAISPSPDGIGIIVGVIEPAGQRIVALGHRSKSDRRQPDGDTAFEIGSLTKVFTGLLLAEMAQRGEVSMTDTAAKLLAGTVTVPSRGRQPITLLDLATHTSGLPFMPELPSEGTAAPYAKADLVRFVNAFKPSSPGPARWEYSNLGYWLLGEALASRASQDFEDLLHTRVLAPLGARRSGFALSPGMRANLAVGHDASLEPAPALSTQPVFAMMSAAGGLYSSTNDLLKVMAIGLAYERSPLTAAMKVSVATRRPAAGHGDEQALGWTVIKDDGSELIFRDGGTFGYSSCVAWHPANRMGVVVLSNHVAGVSDIARHLLRPGFPLEPPATLRRRTEVQLPAATLDRYVGRYDAGGEGIFRISPERYVPDVRVTCRLGVAGAADPAGKRAGLLRFGAAAASHGRVRCEWSGDRHPHLPTPRAEAGPGQEIGSLTCPRKPFTCWLSMDSRTGSRLTRWRSCGGWGSIGSRPSA